MYPENRAPRKKKALTPVDFAQWMMSTRPNTLPLFIAWTRAEMVKRRDGAIDTIVSTFLLNRPYVTCFIAETGGKLEIEDHRAFAHEVMDTLLNAYA